MLPSPSSSGYGVFLHLINNNTAAISKASPPIPPTAPPMMTFLSTGFLGPAGAFVALAVPELVLAEAVPFDVSFTERVAEGEGVE